MVVAHPAGQHTRISPMELRRASAAHLRHPPRLKTPLVLLADEADVAAVVVAVAADYHRHHTPPPHLPRLRQHPWQPRRLHKRIRKTLRRGNSSSHAHLNAAHQTESRNVIDVLSIAFFFFFFLSWKRTFFLSLARRQHVSPPRIPLEVVQEGLKVRFPSTVVR